MSEIDQPQAIENEGGVESNQQQVENAPNVENVGMVDITGEAPGPSSANLSNQPKKTDGNKESENKESRKSRKGNQISI